MRGAVFVACMLLTGQISLAQQVVQQPVVGSTSVNTTVSVPDRGRAFLGGVSSAQSGRSQYGPFRSGTSTGLNRQSTSISTSVYIHDLHAMDEEILNSAPTATARRPGPFSSSGRTIREPVAEPVVSADEKVAKYEQLARTADEAGKTVVAKLHWQMAAKYGSKTAERRLAEMAKPSSKDSRQAATR